MKQRTEILIEALGRMEQEYSFYACNAVSQAGRDLGYAGDEYEPVVAFFRKWILGVDNDGEADTQQSDYRYWWWNEDRRDGNIADPLKARDAETVRSERCLAIAMAITLSEELGA